MNVVLYARVSTTRQADNDLSIPDQVRQMQEWCKMKGHRVIHVYIEPGASATDDKRPVFQQMIQDAMQKPVSFDAIIIHSLSRFFRDGIEFGVYERKLKKNQVKVISITQPTSDDAGGEMMRRIINLFDEHQSKENSKHTSRAMKENARQGFFNGSRPPYGYQAVSTGVTGSRGRKKKQLVIHETEAEVVRLAYTLYLNGYQGKSMGFKEIAMHLNQRGLLMRGNPWRLQKLYAVLTDTLYRGDYYFDVIDSKSRTKRPPDEWVKTSIPPIIDAVLFEQVRMRRESRSPEKTPPRQTNSPTLLTGLLKCGVCGGALTVATGKGGRYKYYKCSSRHSKGNQACTSGNLPMEKTNEQVLHQLADKAFAPDRLQNMMAELRKKQRNSQENHHERINNLSRELKQIEERQQRLIDAIETGILELDEVTQRRVQQLKTSKEALMTELVNARRESNLPIEPLRASQIERFSQKLRQKLLSKDNVLAKNYLNLLVDRIVVVNNTARVTGSYSALIASSEMIQDKTGHSNQVPTFVNDWRARRESNPRPLASETNTLSS